VTGLWVHLFGCLVDFGWRVVVGCLAGCFGADGEMGFGLAWAAVISWREPPSTLVNYVAVDVLFAWGSLFGVALWCGWVVGSGCCRVGWFLGGVGD